MQTAKKITVRKSAKASLALQSLLKGIVKGTDLLKLRKGAKLFSQGTVADAIYFVQAGRVQVTVVSAQGRKAVLATMGPRDFLGEGCLAGDSLRTSTATSLEPSTVFRVEKDAMLQALHTEPGFAQKFVASLLARSVNLEEDLRNQLFNHSEKRLAGFLLKLARLRQHDRGPDTKTPRLTHAMLAEIVGTTRSRISFLMNKFKKLGLINYKRGGHITVMTRLLSDVVLSD